MRRLKRHAEEMPPVEESRQEVRVGEILEPMIGVLEVVSARVA